MTGPATTDPTVQPINIFGAVLTVVCDALLEQPNVKASEGYAVLTTVFIVPDEALTMGMLKLGALLHGLVAAVAVTV